MTIPDAIKSLGKTIRLRKNPGFYSEESASHTVQEEVETEGHRPRELGVADSLYHLDADWGTSLAYVLPIALTLTGQFSPIYIIIIAIVMFLVASGYKIICRHNPDGGGVYSSLRNISRITAVIGALLLVTDFIVTQALSITDAFHYLQLESLVHSLPEHSFFASHPTTIWTITILIVLTIINWRGPHFSAKFARIASAPTFILSTGLAIFALPLLPSGIAHIGHFNHSIWELLRNTSGVLLALSGIEAISNMTDVMKDPEKTSKRAINIELLKVMFTTVVLGIAMNALPESVVYKGTMQNGTFEYTTQTKEKTDLTCYSGKAVEYLKNNVFGDRTYHFTCETVTNRVAHDDMLVVMARYVFPGQVGQVYGVLMGVIYGLLLIFAGNTALIGITNITYSLARDNELPIIFTIINKPYGVPIWGLVLACVAPIVTVLLVGANVEALAALYAIGVVGAVTLHLSGTFIAMQDRTEKIITGIGALVMGVLFITLVINKMEATLFACIVVVVGLMARQLQRYIMKYVIHGIEPYLASGAIDKLPKGQVFVPVYDEYDTSLFEFAANIATKNKKLVVVLYLHEINTILEKDPKHTLLPAKGKQFVEKTHALLKKLGVQSHVVYDFADDFGQVINDYRKHMHPEITIVTPHKQSKMVDFLSGNIVKKIMAKQNGQVLIYSNNPKRFV